MFYVDYAEKAHARPHLAKQPVCGRVLISHHVPPLGTLGRYKASKSAWSAPAKADTPGQLLDFPSAGFKQSLPSTLPPPPPPPPTAAISSAALMQGAPRLRWHFNSGISFQWERAEELGGGQGVRPRAKWLLPPGCQPIDAN